MQQLKITWIVLGGGVVINVIFSLNQWKIFHYMKTFLYMHKLLSFIHWTYSYTHWTCFRILEFKNSCFEFCEFFYIFYVTACSKECHVWPILPEFKTIQQVDLNYPYDGLTQYIGLQISLQGGRVHLSGPWPSVLYTHQTVHVGFILIGNIRGMIQK